MTQIPADWYPDPEPSHPVPGRLRYWDGQQWTAHLHDPVPVYAPGYPVAPVIPCTPDGQQIAGWWQRVLAAVIDWFVLLPIQALVLAPVIVLRWGSVNSWIDEFDARLESDVADPFPPFFFEPIMLTILLIVGLGFLTTALYNVMFLRWKQATPGKLVVGLRVRRREAPGPLPWSTILLRVGTVMGLGLLSNAPFMGWFLSLVVLLNYLWPLWDEKKQALHDKVAGTNVVQVR